MKTVVFLFGALLGACALPSFAKDILVTSDAQCPVALKQGQVMVVPLKSVLAPPDTQVSDWELVKQPTILKDISTIRNREKDWIPKEVERDWKPGESVRLWFFQAVARGTDELVFEYGNRGTFKCLVKVK